jgi:hypothetical protein
MKLISQQTQTHPQTDNRFHSQLQGIAQSLIVLQIPKHSSQNASEIKCNSQLSPLQPSINDWAMSINRRNQYENAHDSMPNREVDSTVIDESHSQSAKHNEPRLIRESICGEEDQ